MKLHPLLDPSNENIQDELKELEDLSATVYDDVYIPTGLNDLDEMGDDAWADVEAMCFTGDPFYGKELDFDE